MAFCDTDGVHHLNIELYLDTDTDRFSSLPTTPTCPSFASSFASYGSSSPAKTGADRRSSIPKSEATLLVKSQETSIRDSLSPMTPFSPDMVGMSMISGASMKCEITDLSMHESFRYNDPTCEDGSLHWMAPEARKCPPGHLASCIMPQQYANQHPNQEAFPSLDQNLVVGGALQSSLSRSIFHSSQPSDGLLAEHMAPWRPSMLQTPPRTVAPSATFQPILPSSPPYRIAPSTPIRSKCEDFLTPGIVRTPYSSPPTYLPSDQPVFLQNDSSCRNRQQPPLVRTLKGSKGRGSSRSAVKSTERKENGRPGRVSKPGASRSIREYPIFIEKNSFACNAPDCVDKNGKRKKFRRQEHLKRHQRCHTGYRPYACWVPGCTTKPFSRTDNLNSHLLKTHGKKSPAARNRYIATLDSKSGVFDLDYRGPFTDSGWPIPGK